MDSIKIRQLFFDFFEKKGHHKTPPASLIIKDDPTLLFTNAGMNQFKHLFLEDQNAVCKRITNIQPCLRVSGKHNDLEEVGIDTYHHTLFEMMGTWSFGNYFKQDAIQWAWQLLTQVYQLPINQIYVTIFGGDEEEELAADQESLSIWQQYIDPAHILYGSKKDNFWEMGDTGPCGPCSEIHIDVRSQQEMQKIPGRERVNKGDPLVVEIWNLVFMEYNRSAGGNLISLSAKHVDTGMGLERLAMVLQGKKSTYDTDIFIPLTHNVMRLSGKKYGQEPKSDAAIRVIADHVRAVTFAIADGQLPSNTMAGYVVRKILRRAVRYGYNYLGMQEPFLNELVSVVAQQYLYIYPHIKQQHHHIQQTVKSEEEAFFKILHTGIDRLEQLIEKLKSSGKGIMDGVTAFELYDTHGFPWDLIQMVAEEKKIQVDEVGFQKALQQQRDRSRSKPALVSGEWHTLQSIAHSRFLGYDQLQLVTQIVEYRSMQQKGQEGYQVVLEETPFYPEGGGQVGDTGQLVIGDQTIPVIDTQKEGDRIVHYIPSLPKDPHMVVKAVVDKHLRLLTASNHTATHLLQAALRQVLGNHVQQKGSWVGPDCLRFDFLHHEKLTLTQIQAVEQIVNQKIRETVALQEERNMPLEAAKALGATALFGEKYSSHVRLVTIGHDFSRELCGGTHVLNTGQMGFFKIVSQASVSAATRRIEAVTNEEAEKFINVQLTKLHQISEILRRPQDPIKSLQNLVEQKSDLDKKLHHYQSQTVQDMVRRMVDTVQSINGISVIIDEVKVPDAVVLKQLALQLVSHTTPLFVTLVAVIDAKPFITVAIADTLVERLSLQAHTILKELAIHIQGEGGGQPFFAMGQGKDAGGIQKALKRAKQLIEEIG